MIEGAPRVTGDHDSGVQVRARRLPERVTRAVGGGRVFYRDRRLPLRRRPAIRSPPRTVGRNQRVFTARKDAERRIDHRRPVSRAGGHSEFAGIGTRLGPGWFPIDAREVLIRRRDLLVGAAFRQIGRALLKPYRFVDAGGVGGGSLACSKGEGEDAGGERGRQDEPTTQPFPQVAFQLPLLSLSAVPLWPAQGAPWPKPAWSLSCHENNRTSH